MRGTTDSLADLERLVDRMRERLESQGSYLAVDVTESDSGFTVTADLPGCDREDVEVRLLDATTLAIATHADERSDSAAEGYVVRERRHRSTSRTVSLPAPVDESAVGARFSNGVLTVELPYAEGHRTGTHIEIAE